ncbi:GIY-YIG nuclease family protein [Microbacterium sp. NPDC047426]
MEDGERYIYLIGSPVIRQVKIGLSDAPTRRATALQTGSPVQLLVILAIPGGPVLERMLHDYFKAYRTHGEWFDFGDENPVTLVVSAATLMGYPVHPKRVAREDRPRLTDIPEESPEAPRFRVIDHLARAARTSGRDFIARREIFAYLATIDPAYVQVDTETEPQYLARAGQRLAAALRAEGSTTCPVQRRTIGTSRAWGYSTNDLIAAARPRSQKKPKRAN